MSCNPPRLALARRAPTRVFRRGFSLVEIMVVIVIIGLLAGAVAISMPSKVDSARVTRAKSDIATIVGAIEMFYAEKGRYPTQEEGLDVFRGELRNLQDPWGNAYVYNTPGRSGEPFEVICYGADGREGGQPDTAEADLYSWALVDDPEAGA